MSELAAAEQATQPASSTRRRWVRPTIAAVGYAVIAVLVWRAIDRQRFLEGIARLSAPYVLTILGVAVLHIFGRALRFHRLLLRTHPSAYRWTDGVRIFLIGLSASAVTPARAGDFIKARLVKPHGVPLNVGLGLVMIERMLDLLVVASTIVIMGAVLAGSTASVPWRSASIALLVGLVAGLVVVSMKSVRSPLLRFLAHALAMLKRTPAARAQLEASLADAFTVWDSVFVRPRTFAGYWTYSFAVWAVEFTKLWLVLRFVGVDVRPAVVLFVYPVSIVAGVLTMLPFSEGVVGVTSVALLGSMAAIDSGAATIAVVVDRAASSIPPLLLWGCFAFFSARRQAPAPSQVAPRR